MKIDNKTEAHKYWLLIISWGIMTSFVMIRPNKTFLSKLCGLNVATGEQFVDFWRNTLDIVGLGINYFKKNFNR